MIHTPTSETDIGAFVAEARVKKRSLRIVGGGTRQALGRAIATEDIISLDKFSGVTLFEPHEMALSAKAGTRLSDITALIARHNLMLAFEPMDHRPLLGSEGEPTIGAIAACNISGPRRISHGAARDALIGLRFVNGFGETVKNGGRVMKNVTGLDLVKLQCGAYGTLGVLTEATFKLLPKPERTATLALHGLDATEGVAALSRALGSPFEVSGAAHLPAGIGEKNARTLLRIENFDLSVSYRLGELRKRVECERVLSEIIGDAESQHLWRDIANAAFLATPSANAVWRISTAPMRAPALIRAIGPDIARAHFYDWGGGLIWVATDAADAGEAKIRACVAAVGGHATLVRASATLREKIAVFQPQAPALDVLSRGVKASFDPDGVLNPGLMIAGV